MKRRRADTEPEMGWREWPSAATTSAVSVGTSADGIESRPLGVTIVPTRAASCSSC